MLNFSQEGEVEKRYGALRIIGTIYKVMGVIVLILTVAGIVLSFLSALAVGSLTGYGYGSPYTIALPTGLIGAAIGAAISLIVGGGMALTLYAFGEAIYLLIALEENTRATAVLLGRRKENDF